MPNYPVSPSPAVNRDLRRDRSILALAAALCGALGAAGLAALAVSAQLSTDHHGRAIADASLALTSAAELLERSRGELEAERQALRATRDGPKLACDGHHRRAEGRPHHRRGDLDKLAKNAKNAKLAKLAKHRGHRSRGEGAAALQSPSTIAATTLGDPSRREVSADILAIFTMLRPTGIDCESEHHCQINSAVNEAAELLPTDSPLRARYIPSIRDGERIGTKLYAIRSGSPMKLLGFRNGDLIRSAHFTEATQLDPSSDGPRRMTLSLELERKGETLRKIIDVI